MALRFGKFRGSKVLRVLGWLVAILPFGCGGQMAPQFDQNPALQTEETNRNPNELTSTIEYVWQQDSGLTLYSPPDPVTGYSFSLPISGSIPVTNASIVFQGRQHLARVQILRAVYPRGMIWVEGLFGPEPPVGLPPNSKLTFEFISTCPYAKQLPITDIRGIVVWAIDVPLTYCDRPYDMEITLPVSLKPGIYFVAGVPELFFSIATPGESRSVLVLPYLTAQAYNCHGGTSLYRCGATPFTDTVDLLRPLERSSVLRQMMPSLQYFLIEYRGNGARPIFADVLTDWQLEKHLPASVEFMGLLGHVEYWTLEMRDAFDQAVSNGTSAIILGGNVMWWNGAYLDNGTHYYVDKLGTANSGYLTGLYGSTEGLRDATESMGANFRHGGFGLESAASYGLDPTYNAEYGKGFVLRDLAHFGLNWSMGCITVNTQPDIEFDGVPIAGLDGSGWPVPESSGENTTTVLGYARGYRSGFSIGTVHLFTGKFMAGRVLQFGSIGFAGSAFSAKTSSGYRAYLKFAIDEFLVQKTLPVLHDPIETPYSTPNANVWPAQLAQCSD